MNQDEMFKMLDLDASPTPTGPESLKIESQEPGKPAGPKQDNALILDRWAKRQGRQLLNRLADEILENGTQPDRPIHQMNAVDLADMHHSVFDPSPELAEDGTCGDRQKWTYFNELMNTPGFHELRQSTVLDDTATELAIERLSEGLDTLRKFHKDDDVGDGFGPGREAGKAVGKAKKDVDDLNDAREGLGIGDGAGGQIDVKETIRLYKEMRRNPNLQKIINLAGKYRLFGQSQQRRKVAHGYDDMVGVTIGSDLPRLTQSEFLALGIPELEDDVCRRLLDSQAMIQEFRGNEPVAKGPMILCIDESGSMEQPSGDGFTRIQHAKALALSFAYLARQQHRWCALVAWSSETQRRPIVLPPESWNQNDLMAWLLCFWNGGTAPPVSDMPEIYKAVGAPEGKTDIVYITDGSVYIDSAKIAAYNTWKAEVNAKVVTLSVGATGGQMADISDEIHLIQRLGLNDATARVLSL